MPAKRGGTTLKTGSQEQHAKHILHSPALFCHRIAGTGLAERWQSKTGSALQMFDVLLLTSHFLSAICHSLVQCRRPSRLARSLHGSEAY